MLRYFTAGESHGEALVAFLSGLPAGLKVDQAFWTANCGVANRVLAAAVG